MATAKKVTRTIVEKVRIGRPVRKVVASSRLSDLRDVELSNLEDGSVLVYDDDDEKWKSTRTLEKQIINGGGY